MLGTHILCLNMLPCKSISQPHSLNPFVSFPSISWIQINRTNNQHTSHHQQKGDFIFTIEEWCTNLGKKKKKWELHWGKSSNWCNNFEDKLRENGVATLILSLFRNTPHTNPTICISQITLALSQHIEALVNPGVEQVPTTLHIVLHHPKRRILPRLEPPTINHLVGTADLVQQLCRRNLLEPDHLVPQIAPTELDSRRATASSHKQPSMSEICSTQLWQSEPVRSPRH